MINDATIGRNECKFDMSAENINQAILRLENKRDNIVNMKIDGTIQEDVYKVKCIDENVVKKRNFSRDLPISTTSSCHFYLQECIVDNERRIPNMNQEKIGQFIAECRKEQNYTQAALAEKLGITDRAISKWENGKSMPDASIMLELCELLKINVNELLTGEHIIMDNYKEIAEKNLIEMRNQEERANKKLLSAETFLTTLTVIASLALIFTGGIIVEINTVLANILISLGTVIVLLGIIYALKLEHDAGYYECPKCKKRYVPTMKAVVMAPHYGTTRKMRCPYCNSKGYHKKVLTKD